MQALHGVTSDTHLLLHCDTTAAHCCLLNRHQHDHILGSAHTQRNSSDLQGLTFSHAFSIVATSCVLLQFIRHQRDQHMSLAHPYAPFPIACVCCCSSLRHQRDQHMSLAHPYAPFPIACVCCCSSLRHQRDQHMSLAHAYAPFPIACVCCCSSLRHQRHQHMSLAHPYAPFPIARLEKAVAALPSSSLPLYQQELGTFGQSHTFTW